LQQPLRFGLRQVGEAQDFFPRPQEQSEGLELQPGDLVPGHHLHRGLMLLDVHALRLQHPGESPHQQPVHEKSQRKHQSNRQPHCSHEFHRSLRRQPALGQIPLPIVPDDQDGRELQQQQLQHRPPKVEGEGAFRQIRGLKGCGCAIFLLHAAR